MTEASLSSEIQHPSVTMPLKRWKKLNKIGSIYFECKCMDVTDDSLHFFVCSKGYQAITAWFPGYYGFVWCFRCYCDFQGGFQGVLVITRWVLECSAGHQAISRFLGCFGRIVLGVELHFRGSGVVQVVARVLIGGFQSF